MVDTVPQNDPEQAPAVEPAASKSPSFFSTSGGKVVAAVIAVFVLLIVAGIALFIFFVQGPDTSIESVTPPPVVTTEEQEQESEAVEPAKEPLSSTFVFRNIFAPSVKAPAPPQEASTDGDGSSDGSSGGGSGTTAGSNELVLVSIQTVDGERTATMSWNGETYVLSKGDTIPNTPWKIVAIGSDSVSVIYGDSSPVELTVGSSVSK